MLLGRVILKLIGWECVYTPSPTDKALYIVYPHTSNWDFPLGILFKMCVPVSVKFVIKASWFHPTIGWFFKWLGGIPVDRSVRANMVDKYAELFNTQDSFYLAIAPEGTRAFAPYLKSGFYYIALKAQVPIALAFIDYGKKQLGVRHYLLPSGDIDKDMAVIREAYQQVSGKYPQNMNTLDIKR